MKSIHSVFTATVLGSLLLTSFSTSAQTTAFTYQGRLADGGSPASGWYDLTFTLYTSSNSVSSLAGPVTNLAVFTTNGLFATTVDFGPGIFATNSEYLALGVRTNGGGNFTPLSPRQAMTAAPYATYAANAAAAASATTATTASFVAATNVAGTLADVHLSSNVALRSGGNALTGNQTINSGAVGIGTITPNYRLSLGGDFLNTKLAIWDGAASVMGFGAGSGQFRLHLSDSSNRFSFLNSPAGSEVMTILGIGRLGINNAAPTADLHVKGSTAYNTETLESTDINGSWLNLKSDAAGGKTWSIISSGPGVIEGAGQLLFYNQASNTVPLDLAPNGYVGIGTTNPAAALEVSGNIVVDDGIFAQGVVSAYSGDFNYLHSSGVVVASGNVMVNNTNYAVSSQENLRIVRGQVNSDGTIAFGSGFTVSHIAAGVYQVNFQPPFSSAPVITSTAINNGLDSVSAQIGTMSSSNFTVGTRDTGSALDIAFTFIAIGN